MDAIKKQPYTYTITTAQLHIKAVSLEAAATLVYVK
jgi:hypothetical protein